MNRNYFTHPNQAGGRNAADYGRTQIDKDVSGINWSALLAGIAVGVLVVWLLT